MSSLVRERKGSGAAKEDLVMRAKRNKLEAAVMDVEPLEARQLMSGNLPVVTSVSGSAGLTLDVVATGGEQVKICQNSQGLQVNSGGTSTL
jgi:hypothetical protein